MNDQELKDIKDSIMQYTQKNFETGVAVDNLTLALAELIKRVLNLEEKLKEKNND